MSTPCPPNAATDRTMAPRSGIASPSRATINGACRDAGPRDQVRRRARKYMADPQRQALVTAPRSAGQFRAARLDHRDSRVRRQPDHLADPLVGVHPRPRVQGGGRHPARSDSSTELRPATTSGAVTSTAGARPAPGPRKSWARTHRQKPARTDDSQRSPPARALGVVTRLATGRVTGCGSGRRRCAGWPGRW